jgi:enterochelin esterase-like enzyme
MAFIASGALAQVETKAPRPVSGARPVTVERIKVHSPAIAGNLEGDSADRDVIVLLPSDYAANRARRYPVVYALHGYSIGAEQWSGEIHASQTVANAFARGARSMIVVLPDSKTAHNGSMYSSSATTGDFERFVSHDLIAAIDARYRTIPKREARGLAGHSMGGYGTTRIGMKHADIFGALYIMSPCCLSPRALVQFDPKDEALYRAMKSPADSATLSWGQRAQLATAAAWSPNPKAPPLYLDMPYRDGKVQEDVLARWGANAPLAFVDQYIGELRRYRGIAIDVGDRDGLKEDASKLHAALDRYGVANSFEIYSGDHVSGVPQRFEEKVIPFFSRMLTFEKGVK